jgi:uncharacterized protein (TIGR03435 family)
MRIAIALATLLAAQASAPRFEVASIKENKSGALQGGLRAQPGGRFEWTNTTLMNLVRTSHQRFSFDQREIVGGPDWIDSVRFDVLVQTGIGTPPVDPDGFPSETFAMIRTLLQERFQLAVHNEVRERPIYELVLARRDGRLGAGLQKVEADCASAMKAMSEGRPAPAREKRGPDCTIGGGPGRLIANAVTVDVLARVLGGRVGRTVVDETGLSGSFDVDLVFSQELTSPLPGGRDPDDRPAATADAPSIFTAVQEQLGLRLESARGPVDVLVVDKAERPTEN